MLVLAGGWADVGIVSASILIGLLIVLAYASREKRHQRIKVGFFIERERFPDDEQPEDTSWKPDPGAEDETLVRWPGEQKEKP